jgi:integrase
MKKAPVNQKGNVPIRWDESRGRYRLDYYVAGKRRVRFSASQKELIQEWKDHCQRVDVHGRYSAVYDRAAHEEYQEARRIAGGYDLREVARFYAEHHKSTPGETIAMAIGRFLSDKERRGVSDCHLKTLTVHLRRFCASFGNMEPSSVSGNSVLGWLNQMADQGLDPRTIRNYYLSVSNFAKWCERRGLTARSFVKDIHEHDLPLVAQKPKGILSVDQTREMMSWLEMHRPHYVAWYALQLFAGLRNAEVGRVRWEWIDPDKQTITLPGWQMTGDELTQVTKTQDDWVLFGLPDNLFAWLRKYRGEGDVIHCPAWKSIDIMRKKYFPLLPDHPIPEWPQNAMRHTFCTMMISLHGSADKVALWSRHRNTSQLYQSYVTKLVSPEVARGYLEIVPKNNLKKVLTTIKRCDNVMA